MKSIHGQATIRSNGTVMETEDDATLKPGGTKRNQRMIGKKGFYSETTIPSEVVCRVPFTADDSLIAFQEMIAEITFESDVGKTYIIHEAVQTGEIELSGGENGGTVELTFMGEPAEEMV